jgi:GNAT superfamily N-acetyltransferase
VTHEQDALGAAQGRAGDDGAAEALDDEVRLLADLAQARRYGFGAKLCIHPKQIAPIHRALQPSVAAVDWAKGHRARVVTLRVDADNATARGVYEQLGFGVVEGNTGARENRPNEITMSLSVG